MDQNPALAMSQQNPAFEPAQLQLLRAHPLNVGGADWRFDPSLLGGPGLILRDLEQSTKPLKKQTWDKLVRWKALRRFARTFPNVEHVLLLGSELLPPDERHLLAIMHGQEQAQGQIQAETLSALQTLRDRERQDCFLLACAYALSDEGTRDLDLLKLKRNYVELALARLGKAMHEQPCAGLAFRLCTARPDLTRALIEALSQWHGFHFNRAPSWIAKPVHSTWQPAHRLLRWSHLDLDSAYVLAKPLSPTRTL